ncbi:hypothetical protein M3Y99_01839000 [Aphelenchoides fujianensis]|nr:hypothetical protein M3Y99_01839000 [Aphelenchoides fujianensis]
MMAQALAHAPAFHNEEAAGSAAIRTAEWENEDGRSAVEQAAVDKKAEDEGENDDFGPALPPGFVPDESVKVGGDVHQKGGRDSEDEDEEREEEIGVSQLIPAACEATIRLSQATPISALTMDAQGSKFALGNFSYFVHLFEYLKMDSALRPFRELQPSESHVINDLAWSANGEHLLIASGESIIKILDRKGQQWCETVRGDQYLVDVALTKGHTAMVNAVCWNPLKKDETIRVWSTEDYKQLTHCINTQRSVIRTKNAGGKRVAPRVCCYSRDGKLFAAGCEDGSLHIWKHGTVFVHARYLNRTAHKAAITGLEFSPNGKQILTRGMDAALRLFALDSIRTPKHEVVDLPNCFGMTDCGYSPHAEFVFTGVSRQMRAENNGTMKNYYDPESSVRGIRQCVTKPIRRPRVEEVVREDFVLAPLALEMFQPRGEEGEEKEVTEWRIKKFLRIQSNAQRPKFRQPADMPMTGHSAGGRLAKSGGSLHSYIAQQLGTEQNRGLRNDTGDVREAILRHAQEAAEDPQFVANAYAKTQPVPIFQQEPEEAEGGEDEDDDDAPVFKAAKLDRV